MANFHGRQLWSADAELGSQKTGTFGDVSTFSTLSHIATMGGMVLTDDIILLLAMRAHGWTRIFPDRPGF